MSPDQARGSREHRPMVLWEFCESWVSLYPGVTNTPRSSALPRSHRNSSLPTPSWNTRASETPGWGCGDVGRWSLADWLAEAQGGRTLRVGHVQARRASSLVFLPSVDPFSAELCRLKSLILSQDTRSVALHRFWTRKLRLREIRQKLHSERKSLIPVLFCFAFLIAKPVLFKYSTLIHIQGGKQKQANKTV